MYEDKTRLKEKLHKIRVRTIKGKIKQIIYFFIDLKVFILWHNTKKIILILKGTKDIDTNTTHIDTKNSIKNKKIYITPLYIYN